MNYLNYIEIMNYRFDHIISEKIYKPEVSEARNMTI